MDPNPDGSYKPHFMLIAKPVKDTEKSLYINFNKQFYEQKTYGLTGCKLDEWNVFTFSVKLSSENDGYIDLYVNGTKVPNLPGHNGSHTYEGQTMRYPVDIKRTRFQCGGYVYWSNATKYEDYFIHYLDDVKVAIGTNIYVEDLLPSSLPDARDMKWELINMN